MRLIFMGTPDFAVPTLEALLKSEEHEVVSVVTQPDKRRGRGNEVQFSPVKELALQYGVPVYQPIKIKNPDSVEEIRRLKPDAIIVVAFGQILSKELLEIPPYGCINVHGSLLPKYRGAAPIQWAVINGEKETGVTVMMMDVGVDTGDMLKKASVPIAKKETAESLYEKLAPLGGSLVLEVLEELKEGHAVREKQDDSLSCQASMLDKRMGNISWEKPAEEIERLIRGLNSWPSAYTMLNGRTLKIWDADVLEEESKKAPGTVVKAAEGSVIIQTGKGCLTLKQVQLEGKKRMSVDAFLRGYPLQAEMKLG